MRIAFFTDTFLPQVNGIVTVIVDVAKKLADHGHKVYIIAPKLAKEETFAYRNIKVKRCKGIPALFYEDFRIALPFNPFLIKFIRDEKIELIHFHTPISLGLQGILIAKMLRLPLIGTFHTLFAHPQYLKHVKLDYQFIERLAWKFAMSFYNRCEMVVCPSEGIKAELLRHNCRRPVKVIPHGIDSSVFDNRNAKKVKLGYNKNGKLLLFVGRIAHEKNLPFLLECFAVASARVPTAKLLIVGSGPQMQDVRAKAIELGVKDKIILKGRMEHDKLVKSGIFGACDIFVSASTTETGPITVLEAQANGLVCVGVKGRGMGLIKNGINGYEVEPGDKDGFTRAVVELLTNRKKYIKLQKATLKGVKRFEMSNVTDVWEKTYKEAINNRSK